MLLQNRATFTNWGKIYYKLRQVLQIRAIITNWGITDEIMISITHERTYCMQRHVYDHFDLPGHSGLLNDISATLIYQEDLENPNKREDYWIHILKTKASLGLNSEDDL